MFDYQILVLNRPYYHMKDHQVQSILADTINLKLDGFATGYPDGVVPFDTTDFISTHILVGVNYLNRFLPLAGFKSVDPQVCEYHRVGFPLYQLLSSSKAASQLMAVKSQIGQHLKHNKKVQWDCSYTIYPELRKYRDQIKIVKDIISSMHINFHRDNKTDIAYMSGVVRFKVNEYFKSWGCQPIVHESEPLPTVNQYSLHGEEVELLKFDHFDSEQAEKFSQDYFDLWKNKKVLGDAIVLNEGLRLVG